MKRVATLLFYALVFLGFLNGALQAFATPVDSTAREVAGELMITKSEEQAIAQLQKLLAKHKGRKDVEPGLWFRLAEMYMRRAKSARFFEMNKDSDLVVRFTPPVIKKTSSEKYVLQAIDAYELIQRQFPRFEMMDLVLFNNAFARQQVGQSERAKALYLVLVKEHTYSELIPDAYLALGEIHYDQRDFKGALAHFTEIKRFPNSRVYSYGLYKKAWAHYNLKETKAGLEELEAVAAYSRKIREEGGDPKLDLRREALSDMVLYYSEIYEAAGAPKYFAKHAEESEMGFLLLKLGRLEKHHGRFPGFVAVHEALISKYSMALEVPTAHGDLIEHYDSQKLREKSVDHLKALAKVCDEKGDWVSKNKQAKTDGDVPAASCSKLFAGLSSSLATKWHNHWLKLKEDSLADVAESAYRLYLTLDSGDVKHVQARNSYADLLFQRKKFREASSEYELVATKSGVPKQKEDSYYAAMVSLEKAVNNKWDDKDEARFKDLVKAYVTGFPKAPYVREVQFTLAFIAYEKGRYDEAAGLFLVLADGPSSDPKTLKAQDIYLDILNMKKNWAGLKVASSRWSKEKGLSPERQDKMTKLYRESWFSEIQTMEEKKAMAEASSEYKKFANENPDSQLSDKALWNAVRIDFDLVHFADAAATAHLLYKRYPKSERAKEALMKAAQTWEYMGQLSEAAEVLEDLIKVDPKDAEKWQLVAADFYALTGKISKARKNYEILAKAKDAERAQQAIESLRHLEEKAGDKTAALKVRQSILDRGIQPSAGFAKFEILNETFDKKDYTAAFKVASELLRMEKAPRKAMAGARYIQARILEEEFLKQSLKASPERFALVLSLKTEKLDKAQRAFQDVIKIGDPEYSVRAMQRIGLSNESYAKSIRAVEFPAGTNKADVDALMGELERLVAPIEDRVADTFGEAIKAAKKFQMHDGIVPELQADLDRVNMRGGKKVEWKINLPAVAVPEFAGGES